MRCGRLATASLDAGHTLNDCGTVGRLYFHVAVVNVISAVNTASITMILQCTGLLVQTGSSVPEQ